MFEKKTLANGVRIVYEYIPYVRSASLGIWVGTGSRYEKAGENGASHFIEHMVFKGTGTRSATDIAAITDRIGGQINAFTTKECTCRNYEIQNIINKKIRESSPATNPVFSRVCGEFNNKI